jgi:hypothetical protein
VNLSHAATVVQQTAAPAAVKPEAAGFAEDWAAALRDAMVRDLARTIPGRSWDDAPPADEEETGPAEADELEYLAMLAEADELEYLAMLAEAEEDARVREMLAERELAEYVWRITPGLGWHESETLGRGINVGHDSEW